MLFVASRGGQLLVRDHRQEERLTALEHAACGSFFRVGRPSPLDLFGELDQAGVLVRDRDPPQAALWLDHVDDAPIGELGHHHARQLVE